jgi:SAM-dependent methyltransferase
MHPHVADSQGTRVALLVTVPMIHDLQYRGEWHGLVPVDAARNACGAQTATVVSPYEFKQSPYSSHSRLLDSVGRLRVPSRILDLGGGEGFLSRRIRTLGHEVVCVAEPGSVAPGLAPDVRVIEADLDIDRPRLIDRFDMVICGDVLEHLKDPAATLAWLRPLLAPSGVLVASVPNGVHLYVRLHVLAGRFPRHDRGLFDRTHLHFLSLDGWGHLFSHAGLDITDVTVTPVPFSLIFHSSVAGSLERLALMGAYVWKQLLAYQFVITAKSRLQ